MPTLNVTSKPAKRPSAWLEPVLGILLAVCVFAVFTNGIPLVDAGIWHADPASKKPYLKFMRLGVVLFMAPVMLIAALRPRKEDQPQILRLLQSFAENQTILLTSILTASYIVIGAVVGWMRHAAMETRAFDLGIFAQALWNPTQGEFLYSSLKEGIVLLGDHVSLILAAVAPFYKLWPDPRLLILFQAIAAAACLPLITWIAAEKTGSRKIAVIFALLYFFYQPTRGALHEDFHPEVLIEPFIFLSFIFLEKRKLPAFLVCLAVVATGKENMLAVAFILGFYAAIFKNLRILGGFIMVISAATFFWEVNWLIPHLSGKPYLYHGFYRHLATGPWYTGFAALAHPDSLEYILKVFLPVLFLPFFHLPTLLLTLPILLQNLLSNNEVFRSFAYHYTTGLTPFVFIAAIYGLCQVLRKIGSRAVLRNVLITGLLMMGILRSGPAEYFYYWQSRRHATPYRDEIRSALSKVPAGASVLTHNCLIPQIVNRRNIYQFEYNDTPTKGESAKKYNVDYVIMVGDFWEPNTANMQTVLEELGKAGYIIEHRQDGFIQMRRGDYDAQA